MRQTGNKHRKAEIIDLPLGGTWTVVLVAKGTFDTSGPPHMGALDPIVNVQTRTMRKQ